VNLPPPLAQSKNRPPFPKCSLSLTPHPGPLVVGEEKEKTRRRCGRTGSGQVSASPQRERLRQQFLDGEFADNLQLGAVRDEDGGLGRVFGQ